MTIDGKRPYIAMSFAQSIDGCIAFSEGERSAISCQEALGFVHALRAKHAGILVGGGTFVTDDPSLTVRYAEGPQPQRIVVARRLNVPDSAKMCSDDGAKPWFFCAEARDSDIRRLREQGCRVFCLADAFSLPRVLAILQAEGLASILVEGGATIIGLFLQENIVDQMYVTVAPRVFLGAKGVRYASLVGGMVELLEPEYEKCGADLVISGRPSFSSLVVVEKPTTSSPQRICNEPTYALRG